MSLIEKAAERLEMLRRAGVAVPDIAPARPATAPPEAPVAARQSARRVDLDLARLAAEGFMTPGESSSRVSDEFRIVKRPLIVNALPTSGIARGNLIMVTSAMPGEGKTFCTVNLAMSIAMELDRTVLLVDADVVRPSVPQVLGVSQSKGLFDVLDGKAGDISEVLLRTNVDKLVFLPSGEPRPRASELLASDAMTAVLDQLASRYPDRIILFDSPPLLVTTEARILATHMGQVVFVVQAEQTLRSDVTRALSLIESCPIKLMLLNQARPGAAGGQGYGFGYGYGNAYGRRYGE